MKLTSREWHCAITSATVDSMADSTKAWFQPSTYVKGLWVVTRVKYFRKEIDSPEDVSEYFSDKWRPTAKWKGDSILYKYPVFVRKLESLKGHTVIAAPFSGLLEEIIRHVEESSREPQFLRPLIRSLYDLTAEVPLDTPLADLPKDYWRAILTGARLKLRSDIATKEKLKQVRSMSLSAADLRHSELFMQLLEPNGGTVFFELDPSLLRIQYNTASGDSLAVRLDEHGNYHLRPGTDGENLVSFDSFLSRWAIPRKNFLSGNVYPWHRKTHDILAPVTPSA